MTDSISSQCVTEQVNSKRMSTHLYMVEHHTNLKVCLHSGAPYKLDRMSVCFRFKLVCKKVSRQLNFLSGPWVDCTLGAPRGREQLATCIFRNILEYSSR